MESTERYRTLQQGEMLNWYRIERVLGRGGFGVIYLATDTNLDHQVAIKEYVPGDHVIRNTGSGSVPTTAEAGDLHQWGLERFLREARNLVKFKHSNIVRVISVFEQNNTAYLVMEFEEGEDLRSYFSRSGHTSEGHLKSLILPIAEGLAAVHSRGFIHRDIKPSNILMRSDGTPVLLDFGSARETSRVTDSAFTALVSVGFAPLEQYSSDGDQQQGPWTDIYALGGVLYSAVCGCDPTDSTRRGAALFNGGRDPMISARLLGEGRYSNEFLSAIDWALAFKIADRPQTLADWMPALLAEGDDSGWHPQAALDLAPPIDLARAAPLSDRAKSWLDEANAAASSNPSAQPSASGRHRRTFDSSRVPSAWNGAQPRYTRRATAGRRRNYDEGDIDEPRSRRPSSRRNAVASRRVSAYSNTPAALESQAVSTGSAQVDASHTSGSGGGSASSDASPQSTPAGLTVATDSRWKKLDSWLLHHGRRFRYRLKRTLGFKSVVLMTILGISLAIWLADRHEEKRERAEAEARAMAASSERESPEPVAEESSEVPTVSSHDAGAATSPTAQASPSSSSSSSSSSSAAESDDELASVGPSASPSPRLTAAERRAAERLAATKRAEAKQRLATVRRQAEVAQRRQINQSLAAVQKAIDAGNIDAAVAELEAARSLGVDESRLAALGAELDRVTSERDRPVSDADVEQTVTRFNALARAIESKDISAMNRLTINSDQNALFEKLIGRFDKIDIDIVAVRVRNADRTISATLRIKDMERTTGSIATPSESYRDRSIASRRVAGEWSQIRW